jgi:hypothetical protein
MRKFYNQALVVLLAALVGVAVSNKLGETYGEVRQLTSAVSQQVSRSGPGLIAAGGNLAARFRRDGATLTRKLRPCRQRAAASG